MGPDRSCQLRPCCCLVTVSRPDCRTRPSHGPRPCEAEAVAHFIRVPRQLIDLGSFRAGCHEYFEELVRAHGPLVLMVAQAYGDDADRSEDLFQEIWKHVYVKRESYGGHGSFEGWLHRLATNVCRSDYRTMKVRSEALNRMTQQGQGKDLSWLPLDPLDETERRELHLRLHRALAHLSKREHEAITLRILDGRKPEEVAQIMGIEKATVRSHISRAIKRLREVMEGPGDELSRYQPTH